MTRNKKSIKYCRLHPDNEREQQSLRIFDLLKKETDQSVKDISRRTGVPESDVADYINICVKKDLLKISGEGDKGMVSFSAENGKFLGVGFTPLDCVLTVMDLSGSIAAKEHIEIELLMKWKGKNKELKTIVETIEKGTKLADEKFTCAGVAVPETMIDANAKSMTILGEGIARIFGCDALVSKAATAAGYGESDYGNGAEMKDILYMHSDLGAGVIIKEGMLFEADSSGAAADYQYLRPWKQFGVVVTAKSLVNKGLGTDIVKMVNGDIEKISLDVVIDAAGRKDELAGDLVKRSGLALGVRVAYLINMFNTCNVILGGGIERKEGGFIELVKESSGKFLLDNLVSKVEVIPGKLGREASSIGAASLCRRESFMEVLEV